MTWDWTWHPHPDVWALGVVLLGGYFLAMRRWAPAGAEPSKRQRWCWIGGVATIVVASEWPMHDLAERSMYSMHMVQHMLLTLVAPPLLLIGTPAWLARKLLPGALLRFVRFVSRPLMALVLFNGLLVLTHWPVLVNASVGNELLHFTLHTSIVLTALAMWMPVLSPLLEIPRLSLPGQMLYLFLQSLVPTIPASFLTFGERPLYRIYEAMPKLWGMTALEDQLTAGLIMKIGGGLVLWGAITAIFFRWSTLEQRDGVDLLQMQDLDKTLNRMELT